MVLSPAAQAVLDAMYQVNMDSSGENAQLAAAALHAAADQVISLVLPPGKHFDVYAQGFRAARVKYRSELLALAAELDSTPITPLEEN
jgi:hypothetical protein